MHAALGLFVVALFGAESTPTLSTPTIQYRVKLLEMDGLKWRESIYTRLQPVARQGTCSIWTANRELAKPLIESASRVLMAPQVMAEAGSMATYSHRTMRKVASHIARHADGPVDHAVSVAYTTNHENLGEGIAFKMAGRKLDQGMLLKVAVEDQSVAAVHHVTLTEFVPSQDGKDGKVSMTPQLDVPEVVKSTLEGEWLIPMDGMLVTSLGARTMDDGQGKAIVRERLLIIEVNQGPSHTSVDLTQTANRVFTYVAPVRSMALPTPVSVVPPSPMKLDVPVPALPSRSLPMARAADGTPVPLPPLPESQVPPTQIPGTSEPCATPQTANELKESDKTKATPPSGEKSKLKSIDAESLKASYQPGSEATDSAVTPPVSQASSPRPYVLRLPIGPGIEIEVSAKVLPGKSQTP